METWICYQDDYEFGCKVSKVLSILVQIKFNVKRVMVMVTRSTVEIKG